VALAPKASDLGLKSISKTPDALTERARELVRQFGYADEPADMLYLDDNVPFCPR